MLPRSGRTHGTAYDPDDTWDNYVASTSKVTPLPEAEKATFVADQNSATSEAALVKAFAQSNAMQALAEETAPFVPGRKMLQLQHKESTFDQVNPNILPTPAVHSTCLTDEYYVGGLGVEDRFKASDMVDRLGNEYEIWESQLPPPDKDYSTIAPGSSQRHLERCMGADPYFYDRPKREVTDDVNPAEPRGDGMYKKERQSAAELKGRQTFFNQAGMQHSAQIDTGRSNLYDGYNMKTKYSERTYPVEPCWRATQSAAVHQGAEPTLPSGNMGASIPSQRKEVGGAFGRAPNKTSISVRSARISLPFVSAASLRADKLSGATTVVSKLSAGFEAGRAGGNVVDHNERKESGSIGPVRPAIASTVRTNPAVAVNTNGEAANTAREVNRTGPAQYGGSLTDTQARVVHRDNTLIKKPAATRDWEVSRRITQGVDHMGEDATEIYDINRSAMRKETDLPAPREELDHAGSDDREIAKINRSAMRKETELPAPREELDHTGSDDREIAEINRSAMRKETDLSSPREGVDHEASDEISLPDKRAEGGQKLATQARATVQLGERDVKYVDEDRPYAAVHAGQAHVEVTRTGRDEVDADRRRPDQVVSLHPTESDVTRTGRPDVTHTYSAKQQLSSQHPVRASIVPDDMREMHDQPVDRDALLVAPRVVGNISANGTDVVRVDRTHVDSSSLQAHPSRATQNCPATQRQQVNPEGAGSAALPIRVDANPSVSEERPNAATMPRPNDLVVAGRPSIASDSLPLEDRACVAISPHRVWTGPDHRLVPGHSDVTLTNRTHAMREARGSAHRAVGIGPTPRLQTTRCAEPNVYARTGQRAKDDAGSRPALGNGDRPESARVTYRTQVPVHAAAQCGAVAPMRALPVESLAVGGNTKNRRLDSAGQISAPKSLIRPARQLGPDRSTPTRALTPSQATAARWTPSLQIESNREVCNWR